MNHMQKIQVEKVTLNIGTGKSQDQLEKGLKLLQTITQKTPIKTITQKRIAGWGLRPGLPIGCKITLRKKTAEDVLKRMVEAKDFVLGNNNFDQNGSISFGISEYIDIPGLKYSPEIGTMGLQVCITLQRPGYRIKYRKVQKKKVSPKHKINKNEAIKFMQEQYKVNMEIKE